MTIAHFYPIWKQKRALFAFIFDPVSNFYPRHKKSLIFSKLKRMILGQFLVSDKGL
jgi:hypothetical protein